MPACAEPLHPFAAIEAAEYENDDVKLEQSIARDLTLHAWMLSQSGIPVIYGGDEVGQLNDYTYHDDPDKREDSRYLHRGVFRWDITGTTTCPVRENCSRA